MSLPAAVALYFDLEDRRDLDALERCLAPHATITDERRVYTGLPEIKAWRLETARKYQHTTEALKSSQQDSKIDVTARVSGTFPGSPVDLHFNFVVKDGLIASLRIG